MKPKAALAAAAPHRVVARGEEREGSGIVQIVRNEVLWRRPKQLRERAPAALRIVLVHHHHRYLARRTHLTQRVGQAAPSLTKKRLGV